ncbi:MAG: cytochrome ubiquinol oxidase subunit I [Acidimicrobiia bacterium]|nr:cytochrome ubiquinol oxidase subunit I [Acidimicrobiia bacterium]
MAFTLAFHMVFAAMGIGFPLLILIAERRAIVTGDPVWREIARRWSKVFAVLFAVGAVSGTVLSFELGLLWPGFMGTFGSVIGLPFTMEGFAFFTEAIFLGIYLYGWDRLSAKAHFWAGVPVAVAGAASGFFVVLANAWMNQPGGYTMENGIVTAADPVDALFNSVAASEVIHAVVATYMVAGFGVAAVYAVLRLRGNRTDYVRKAMGLGLALGIVFAPLQVMVGDWSSRVAAEQQPVKFAAMEAIDVTEPGTPMHIGPFSIPRGAALMLKFDPDAAIPGLDQVAPEDRPPVGLTHWAFQVMFLAGFAMAGLALWSGWSWWRRRRLPEGKAYLWTVAASGLLAITALEAGWVVTEVGRQPWVVQGVMRTADAVSASPGLLVGFIVVIAVYLFLAVATVAVLRILARRPLDPEASGVS